MAKIVIAGDAVVVKSELKLEDIKTIEKYNAKALTLMGGDEGKEPIFALGTTTGTGSINSVGASFGKADADGNGFGLDSGRLCVVQIFDRLNKFQRKANVLK